MAARSVCAELLGRVRRLTGAAEELAPPPPDELQAILDQHMETVWQEMLAPTTSGPGPWREWKAKRGGFDLGAQVFFAPSDALTNDDFAEANPLAGIWVLTEDAASTSRSFWVSGRRYDVHGAAADAAEEILASLRVRAVDVSDADGHSVKRSQQITTLEGVISRLRTRQWASSLSSCRSDIKL
jgi:hypothetical protein